MRVRLMIAIGIVAFAVATAVTASAQGTTMKWTVDGEHRVALVFPPEPWIPGVEHPLVFAFHGHGGNMHGISQLMHIHTHWKEAIVVYPQGVKPAEPSRSPGKPSGMAGRSKPGEHRE